MLCGPNAEDPRHALLSRAIRQSGSAPGGRQAGGDDLAFCHLYPQKTRKDLIRIADFSFYVLWQRNLEVQRGNY